MGKLNLEGGERFGLHEAQWGGHSTGYIKYQLNYADPMSVFALELRSLQIH